MRLPKRRLPTTSVDPWSVVLGLMFPDGLDAEQAQRVAAVIDGPPSLSAMRRALGVLDQQTNPSPMTIRWRPEDVQYADVRGVRLALDAADASVSVQIADGEYEPHVTGTIDRLLAPGDVFVDIGANIGYHSVVASTLVGSAGRVIAIEANAENARLLAHTVALNGLDNVTVLPIAVSDSWGHVTFGAHVGSNGGFLAGEAATSGQGTVAPTVPLDDVGLEATALIKIDVEGAEALVIDGARRLLETNRPAIIMEFSVEMTRRVSRREPAAHLERFVDLGYAIAMIDRVTHTAHPIESVDALLREWGSPVRIEDLLLTPAVV